ncbi:MAG: MBOAT family protein, partial [Treponema sp.]|nr:MBOAT family protein [Treponema sp.]
MTLLSNTFAIFILLTLAVYYLCPKKFQWLCLLAANLVFYAYSGIGNLAFIIASSFVTFLTAKIISDMNSSLKTKKKLVEKDEFKLLKAKTLTKKRLVLTSMLLINIGILFYLKYWRVLIGSKTLLLPLGISYYTLQCIGYFMDVYNDKIEKETNFAKFFLFISFFPQLIMGPINRYGIQGEQLKGEHNFNFENIKHGVMLILFGALKKYVVANLLVTRISAILDKNYDGLPGCVILFAILMYSL